MSAPGRFGGNGKIEGFTRGVLLAPFFSSDLQLTRHRPSTQVSASSQPFRQVLSLAHHPTKTIPSSVTIPSCASSRSMYLLCLIKISYRISYRIYFCLSRWNVVPSTSHLSCCSFPPTPLLPLRLSPSPNTHIVIPAGLRQQCRPISHLHQSAPLPLLWLAMGHPGGAQGASAALGSLLHLVSDATVVSS